MRLPGMFTALLPMTFDAAGKDNAEPLASCRRRSGRTIAMEFSEFGATLYLRPHNDGIELFNHWRGEPDVTIQGTIPALLFANLRREPGAPAGVRIAGDAGIGQEFQKLV